MFQVEGIEEWKGQDVLDRDGERIGKLESLFSDTEDGSPSLGCIKSGRLTKHLALVPLAGASFGRNHVRVPYSKAQVESAPQVGEEGRITRAEELVVARHYGVQAPERDSADDDVRYEPVGAAEERRDRAAQLEAEAERKQAEAESRHSDAASAGEQAGEAEAERRRLLEEAAAIRSQSQAP